MAIIATARGWAKMTPTYHDGTSYIRLHQDARPLLRSDKRPSPAGAEQSTAVGIVSRLLAEGLQKLPRHDGIVARGIRVCDLEDLVSRYAVGQVVEWRGFGSCSTDLAKAADFGNVLFTITSNSGRTLGSYADDPKEQEVLYPPGSTFRVEGLEQRHDRAIISMIECEPTGNGGTAHGDAK